MQRIGYKGVGRMGHRSKWEQVGKLKEQKKEEAKPRDQEAATPPGLEPAPESVAVWLELAEEVLPPSLAAGLRNDCIPQPLW